MDAANATTGVEYGVCVGVCRVGRKPKIEEFDQRGRTRGECGGHSRCVLPEVRRPQTVSKESTHLASGRTVVVAVDRKRQGDAAVDQKLTRQSARSTSAGKQNDLRSRL